MPDNLIPFPQKPREGFVDKYWVASYLRKSVSWVEKQSSNPLFPSHKIGAHRLYRPSEIEGWVQAQRRAA